MCSSDLGFVERLERYCDQLVAAPLIPDAPGRVLIPGEPEAAAERRADERGIVIDREHHEALGRIGDRFGLPLPPWTVPAPVEEATR